MIFFQALLEIIKPGTYEIFTTSSGIVSRFSKNSNLRKESDECAQPLADFLC